VDVPHRITQLGGQRLALLVEDVADHHLGALIYEHLGVRGAHALSPAADQYNFSVHASHGASRYPTARKLEPVSILTLTGHTANHDHPRRARRHR
jgi:hypothetical protein